MAFALQLYRGMGGRWLIWLVIAALVFRAEPSHAVAPGAIVTPADLTVYPPGTDLSSRRNKARSRLLTSGVKGGFSSGLENGLGGKPKGDGSGEGNDGEGDDASRDSGMNTSVGDGSGSGSGSGAGSGKGGAKSAKLGYDDNEKKSMESGEAPKHDDHGHDHGKPPGNGSLSPPPPDPSKPMPYWEPMCFFIHPSVSPADANARIKGIVDHFAACQVAVMPFPFTVPDLPRSAIAAANLAAQVCPLNKKFGVKYSAAQAHVPWDDFSDEMCDSPAPTPPSTDIGPRGKWSKRVGGCAQLDVRGGALSAADQTSLEGRLKNGSSDGSHFGGKATAGGPAFSAVDGGQPWTTAVHEVGHNHSMENYGSGVGTGFGLQKLNTFKGAEGPGAKFNPEGCAHLVAGANPNTVGARYNPVIKDYYRAIPNSPFKMQAGRSFFGEPPPLSPPPPGKQTPPDGDGGGSIARNNPPPGETPPQAPPPTDPPAGGGHKKPKPAPASAPGVASLRNGTAGAQTGSASSSSPSSTSGSAEALAGLPPGEGGAVGAGGTKAYGYDENGNKQFSGDGVAAGKGSGMKIGSGPGFGYDDKAVKTNADGSPVTDAPGMAAGAGTGGTAGSAADGGGRRPASILDDVRAKQGSMMDDDFLKRLKLGEKPEPPKARGESLRKAPALQKALYK